MVKLLQHLSALKRNKILLAGDLMLDRYTFGKASRISPEAPVPVLVAKEEKMLPGGAGNVLLSLVKLNQEVVMLGRIGQDSAGSDLKSLLESSSGVVSHIVVDRTHITPVKHRLIADRQQMLRIDHEVVTPLDPQVEEAIIRNLPSLLHEVKLVALSDYGKGFLTESLVQALIVEAKKQKVPVIVDPKGLDFKKYRGAYLVKPNLKEAYGAAKAPLEADLNEVAASLLQNNQIEKLFITRSEAGISLFDAESRQDFPVTIKEVIDVTGAGDTVLAMLATALASGLKLDKAAPLCNVAASLALEHVGCYQVGLEAIARRLLEIHAEDKFIDKAHEPELVHALKGRPHTIIEVRDEKVLDPLLYEKIRGLKVQPDHMVVMRLSAELNSPSFAQMLASLKEVDFIVKF
jgi:D-beta-D-heptose 7-phosphate kinase/D-beta-D-heptose 1-phosphate adenosyltransferase